MAQQRIQKVLSDQGYCSRRAAEQLIAEGRVKVNGHPVGLGDKMDPDYDKVSIDGKNLRIVRKRQYLYLMLHKPRGYITTASDERGRKTVMDLVADVGRRVYPVGRLDKDSRGLLLMTNNGDIINKMMRSSNRHEKEYRVTVEKEITEDFLSRMSSGVPILDTVTRPCRVRQIGKYTFSIILTQGLNRQIRRMCETLGYAVRDLVRVRVMNIRLGNLKEGQYRKLTDEELEELYSMIEDSSNAAGGKYGR